MDNTILDPIVEYPAKAIRLIGTDERIVGLLVNDPNVDMDSEKADAVFENNIFDYGYVDGTTTETNAYICVEAETVQSSTPTMMGMRLYVTVICHKEYVGLDPAIFKGLLGNRCNNLVRFIDDLLDGSDLFGIGPMSLESLKTVASPNGFTARELTYRVPDFKIKA